MNLIRMNNNGVSFTKFHGLGNDFVIMGPEEIKDLMLTEEKVKKICDRNFGVGADGVLLVSEEGKLSNSHQPGYYLTIYNSDGSRAEMCGNGVRCITHYLRDRDLIKDRVVLKTGAGIIRPELIDYLPAESKAVVKVNMGVPRFSPEDLPVRGEYLRKNSEQFIHDEKNRLFKAKYDFIEEGEFAGFTANFVSMGNPHVIFFLENSPEYIPLEDWGPRIENHDLFPENTNVEFARIVNEEKIEVRVWERGSGITLACGTGAAAVGAAAINNGYCAEEIEIELPGGTLVVEYSGEDINILGPSRRVFRGILEMNL